MGFIGKQPTPVPLTSSDITDGIISTAKIANDAVENTKLDLSANYAFTGTITGAGKVLQVVSGSTSTQVNVASTTYTDTGLTASITPSSTSSKILIIVSQNAGTDRDNNSGAMSMKLLRDSTNIQSQVYVGFIEAGGSSAVKNVGPWSITHLDSPSTTSSVTYKTQGIITNTSNNGTARFQWDSGVSHITLMEISA